jgi:Uma2 family endonuclease
MATAALQRITVDEFVVDLEEREERLELIDGRVRAMTGGTVASFQIAGNIFGHVFQRLRGGPCRPFGDGMLVWIDETTAFAPDALVVCSPLDPQERYVRQPVVIVEVLSPSTESLARGAKWLAYQTLPSLRHYLLVAQDRAQVEIYSRGDGVPWVYEAVRDDPSREVPLPAIGIALTLGEIYEGVELPPPA